MEYAKRVSSSHILHYGYFRPADCGGGETILYAATSFLLTMMQREERKLSP